jgi:hypothetical protein
MVSGNKGNKTEKPIISAKTIKNNMKAVRWFAVIKKGSKLTLVDQRNILIGGKKEETSPRDIPRRRPDSELVFSNELV